MIRSSPPSPALVLSSLLLLHLMRGVQRKPHYLRPEDVLQEGVRRKLGQGEAAQKARSAETSTPSSTEGNSTVLVTKKRRS